MITLTGGNIQDGRGNLLNGFLTLQLTQDAAIIATPGQVVRAVALTFQFANGNLVGTCKCYSNAELTPGTQYQVSFADGNRSRLGDPTLWQFTQASGATVDIGTMVASAAGVSFTAPVLFLPGGDQIIVQPAGTNLLVNRFEGIRYADQFPGTSFNAQIAAAIADLPVSGSGTVDCRNMKNLTMAANLVVNRSNTRLLFGQYTVNQGTFSITVPSPTSNIAMIGMCPLGSDPSGLVRGTYFIYTGTGSAHALGDITATSYNHLVEGITVDITGAGNAAIGIDSSRVYHTIINYPRVIGKIGVTAQIGIRNNGTASAPGSQNMLLVSPYLSNCFIGIQAIGGNSPPTCNMNQWIGGEITGSGSGTAGSIGLDIENGNNNNLYGPTISNYETAIKVASTSNRAIYGDFHSESCVNAVVFTASAVNNILETDSGNTITDLNGSNQCCPPGNLIFSADGQLNRIRNLRDLPVNFSLTPGSSADQQANINFQDKNAVTKWRFGKNTDNTFTWSDPNGNSIMSIGLPGNTVWELNAPFSAAGAIDLNSRANSGSTGTRLFSGGSAPVMIATFGGGTTPLGSFLQPVNKVGQASIVANSGAINTSETIIVKSAALAASRLKAGTHIRVTLVGTCTTTVANTSSFLVRFGTNGTTADAAIATATTGVAGTTGTNIPFKVVIDFTVRTVGASGTGFVTATVDSNGTTGIIASTGELLIQPSMSTFDTTIASGILSFSYVSGATTTTCTFNQAVIEVVYQ